ncbi:MAG: hypothetical protein ABIG20_02165 [archaeon]
MKCESTLCTDFRKPFTLDGDDLHTEVLTRNNRLKAAESLGFESLAKRTSFQMYLFADGEGEANK